MDTHTHTGEVVWDGPYAYGRAARVGMGIRIYGLPIATHLGKICTYVYRTEHYKGQLYINVIIIGQSNVCNSYCVKVMK